MEQAKDKRTPMDAVDPRAGVLVEILALLSGLLDSAWFVKAFRTGPRDFTRKRKVGFADIFMIIVANSRRGLCAAARDFGNWVSGTPEWQFTRSLVSHQALSAARKKIRSEAFLYANHLLVTHLIVRFPVRKVLGVAPVAVDGTDVHLPKSPELAKRFGLEGSKPTGKGMCAYLSYERVFVAGKLAPNASSERGLFKEIMGQVFSILKRIETLFIFDRGFPSREGFFDIAKTGAHFLFRCPAKNFIPETDNAKKGCHLVKIHSEPQGRGEEMWVRVLKYEFPNGETITLVTDMTGMSAGWMLRFYHDRWAIEEGYDFLKHYIGMIKFTGYSENAVRQDFQASLLTYNLVSLANRLADEVIAEEGKLRDARSRERGKEPKKRKHKYHSSRSNAVNYAPEMGRIVCLLSRGSDPAGLARQIARNIIYGVSRERVANETRHTWKNRKSSWDKPYEPASRRGTR